MLRCGSDTSVESRSVMKSSRSLSSSRTISRCSRLGFVLEHQYERNSKTHVRIPGLAHVSREDAGSSTKVGSVRVEISSETHSKLRMLVQSVQLFSRHSPIERVASPVEVYDLVPMRLPQLHQRCSHHNHRLARKLVTVILKGAIHRVERSTTFQIRSIWYRSALGGGQTRRFRTCDARSLHGCRRTRSRVNSTENSMYSCHDPTMNDKYKNSLVITREMPRGRLCADSHLDSAPS